MSESLLRVVGLEKRFGELVALDRVCLDVAAGEIVSIIGPSGSGKSTLIRCVNMLETYEGGSVFLGGEQLGYDLADGRLKARAPNMIARQRARMGMVFQQFNLFPHRTVIENITDAPILVKKMAREDAFAQARKLLALVKLSEKEASYPRHLSGGQQQRVAIARALAMEPELLLFDEPTSALDPEISGEVLQAMRDVARTGATMIVVTHEIDFAREISDRLIFMESGRILEEGAPEEVLHSPTARLARFIVTHKTQ